MNILVLSCLNLDLLDLTYFTQQFAKQLDVIPTQTNKQHVNYYLIDHLSTEDSQLNISSTITVHRISINNFLYNILDDILDDIFNQPGKNKLTTAMLYKAYLAYIGKSTSATRKLIENIFYLYPELINFLQKYVYSVIKLAELLSKNVVSETSQTVQIISCDPIFHHLLAELRAYQPNAVDFFNEQISIHYKLQIWDVPLGWPIGYPNGVQIAKLTKTTYCRFVQPYKEQSLQIKPPQLLTDLRNDNDMYNLDHLTSHDKTSPTDFTGEIIGVLGLSDISTGLTQIFQEQIINRQLRVPRHLIPPHIQPIKIIIHPQPNPHLLPIRVLADLVQHLDKNIVSKHRELLAWTLSEIIPELDILALEWELRIQKYIKLPIKIVFSD